MASFQTLKKAEEEAHRLVEEARQERTQRMKTAKREAEAEIERYNQQQMQKLQALREKAKGKEADSKNLEAATQKALEILKRDAEANKPKVIELLVNTACNVETRVPEARKGVQTTR